ncbi:class I SAM-dependent methyltransferase [Aureivirga marina]|uniref:class I SAM-dependent methyltransferase n=1 Tax=Aureivirga marina TaxID=1182451 RepID=UPI0018C9ED9B|nr:class I SAM-dependent methyltransferase [Aureivirga marina]
MGTYEETFRTWNKIASAYEDLFMDLDLYNDTYDSFLDLISNQNAKILELGCGPGNVTKYLLNKNSKLKILATDISQNMLDLAKKNNPNANFQILDCRNLNQLNKKFDALILGFCIPYISKEDCIKLLNDISNFLNNSGVLYFSFVEGNYKNSGFQTGSSGDRLFFYFHDLNFLKNELTLNNFIVKEEIRKDFKRASGKTEVHTILIAKKI